MSWTSPRTWVAGETVTAALLNQYLRDNDLALSTFATDWTPSWTANTTNPTIGNGTITGRYINVGKLVIFYAEIVAGSTTAFGSGSWHIDLPVNGEVARRFILNAAAFDTSLSDDYQLLAVRSSSDQLSIKCDATTAGASMRAVNATVPFTWATGDTLHISGIYELA